MTLPNPKLCTHKHTDAIIVASFKNPDKSFDHAMAAIKAGYCKNSLDITRGSFGIFHLYAAKPIN